MANSSDSAEERIRGCLDQGRLAEAATAGLQAYGPQIGGYLVAILKDEAAASDVFSDFSEQMWKGIGSFRGMSSFRTWAYKVAWNAAKMYQRDPFRRRVRRLESDDYSRLADQLRRSSLLHADPLAADRLTRLRETLTPEEQTLLILRVDKGLAWKDIAEVLSEAETPVDAAALRKQFERLKTRLLEQAAREGLSDPAGSRGRAPK